MTEAGRAPTSSGDLFQLLRDGRVWTRAELAACTGLARSTIALRLEELLSLGLIAPAGEVGLSTGGRPPMQFSMNQTAWLVMAADLGASHAAVAISDLAGTVLVEHREELNIAEGPETVLGRTLEIAETLLGTLQRDADELIAVGIGLPGPVEHSSGRPVNPPIMPGWDGFDVPGWFQERLAVPVLVDNDVNIMALGERARAFATTEDIMLVKVATGIGAGIISSGVLQRGSRGIAGDIGHIQVPRGAGIHCRCGNTGCLEAIAAGPAIAASLRARGLDAPDSRAVVQLVRDGNLQAIQAVRQAGRDIGEVLTACVSMFNPSVIVIGGLIAQSGEHLLAGIREAVYSRSIPLATEHLTISHSRVGPDAPLVGASMMAIDYGLSPARIAAMSAGRSPAVASVRASGR
jgi:predicted NBD/HSP70 family sugar kinase